MKYETHYEPGRIMRIKRGNIYINPWKTSDWNLALSINLSIGLKTRFEYDELRWENIQHQQLSWRNISIQFLKENWKTIIIQFFK